MDGVCGKEIVLTRVDNLAVKRMEKPPQKKYCIEEKGSFKRNGSTLTSSDLGTDRVIGIICKQAYSPHCLTKLALSHENLPQIHHKHEQDFASSRASLT